MTAQEPSRYRIPLTGLEESARVTDEDRVEEQDVDPSPRRYVSNEDRHVPGYPNLRG